MTVCVAVKVQDGMVFAADSAATLSVVDGNGNRQILNVYNNADKVFNLHRALPLAAMTCGMGHLTGRSISSLAKEFRKELMIGDKSLNVENYTVEDVAVRARVFIEEKYNDTNTPKTPEDFFEFWVGGYGSDNEHGEIWKIRITQGNLLDLEQVNKPGDPSGIFWGGQGEAICRLVLGVDPRLVDVLSKHGIDQANAEGIFNASRAGLTIPIEHPTMPIIDTIRLAKFLVKTTIGYFSFKYGSDIVGGASDIATVTKFEGFKWIERKHFYPANLNREDNGHVC